MKTFFAFLLAMFLPRQGLFLWAMSEEMIKNKKCTGCQCKAKA